MMEDNPLSRDFLIPQSAREALNRYAKHGVPTGDCLRAILSNDLFDAFKRADLEYRAKMFAIVCYIYNNLPMNCYGSREIVDNWIKSKEEELRREKGLNSIDDYFPQD